MAFSLGFSQQSSGDNSNKNITIIPNPKYSPDMSSLYSTIPSHWAKLDAGIVGAGLENSRQQLVSAYARVDWTDLGAFCLTVFNHKKLRGAPTEEQYLAELEKCRPYHMAASMALNRS
jgi:hypothetical protein